MSKVNFVSEFIAIIPKCTSRLNRIAAPGFLVKTWQRTPVKD